MKIVESVEPVKPFVSHMSPQAVMTGCCLVASMSIVYIASGNAQHCQDCASETNPFDDMPGQGLLAEGLPSTLMHAMRQSHRGSLFPAMASRNISQSQRSTVTI